MRERLMFHRVKYCSVFIRFYPPKMRQLRHEVSKRRHDCLERYAVCFEENRTKSYIPRVSRMFGHGNAAYETLYANTILYPFICRSPFDYR